jgi:hypothetical protein
MQAIWRMAKKLIRNNLRTFIDVKKMPFAVLQKAFFIPC